MTQPVSWLAIAPPLSLVVAGLVALVCGAFASTRRRLPGGLSLAGLAAAAIFVWMLRGGTHTAFCLRGEADPGGCSWLVDHVTLVWWLLMIAATGLVVLLVQSDVAAGELPAGELHFLVLASCAGALGVAASNDLLTLVVSMETVSLPAFALVALRRADRGGAEAALKLFVTSVVATAFTLLGISMVYGATGAVTAGGVADAVAGGSAVVPVVSVGMVLTVVGLGFKVALVPFQVWVPDTYVGAPVPIAAYLSVVSKTAGLAGITIVLARFFPAYGATWSPLVAAVAALTMTVGNLAALRQQHVVRLLAWSSVAQAGYLLVPLAAGGTPRDIVALQAYALMYAVVNVGAFAVATRAAAWGATTVGDLTGLARRNAWLGGGLAFLLLCLAGLPPGVVGLVAKLVVFQSAIDAHLTWLAVVMAVNVAVGLVYYLRFASALLRPGPPPSVAAGSSEIGSGTRTGLVDAKVVTVATVATAAALSIYPTPLFTLLTGR